MNEQSNAWRFGGKAIEPQKPGGYNMM